MRRKRRLRRKRGHGGVTAPFIGVKGLGVRAQGAGRRGRVGLELEFGSIRRKEATPIGGAHLAVKEGGGAELGRERRMGRRNDPVGKKGKRERERKEGEGGWAGPKTEIEKKRRFYYFSKMKTNTFNSNSDSKFRELKFKLNNKQ